MNANYAALDLMSTEKGVGRGGIICNIASVMGIDHFFSIPAYVASKHGVIGFTRSFAVCCARLPLFAYIFISASTFQEDFHYQKHSVKFIMICPGFTDTRILDDFSGKLVSEASAPTSLEAKASKPMQTPEIVGRLVADAIETDKNGSIWLIDDGVKSEVTMTRYWNI